LTYWHPLRKNTTDAAVQRSLKEKRNIMGSTKGQGGPVKLGLYGKDEMAASVPVTAVGHGVGPDPDADGGDISFGVGKPYKYGRPGAFRFQGPNGETMFAIDKEGVFRVRGEVVAEDRMVYEGFRLWLGTAMAGVGGNGANALANAQERAARAESDVTRLRLAQNTASTHRFELAEENARLRRQLACVEEGVMHLHSDEEESGTFCGHFSGAPEGYCALLSNVTCVSCLRDVAKEGERQRRPRRVIKKTPLAVRRRIGKLEEAIVWMSAAEPFQKGGEARAGFELLVEPLIHESHGEEWEDEDRTERTERAAAHLLGKKRDLKKRWPKRSR
jgi:hypothetical protein